MDYGNNIREYLQREQEAIGSLDIEQINDAMNALRRAYERNAAIYIMGNGGSAATASHFVCDFNKGACEAKKKKFCFTCLSDNTPILTAIANDISYEDVFVFQLAERLRETDLIIAISGSGNSPNVIKAVEYAKECGTEVIGVTGFDGGRLKPLCDYALHVPIADMQITEDIHMMFDHLMMKIFSESLEADE